MGKRSQSSQSTPSRKQARQRGAQTESSVVLADLKERFARFRAKHRRGTRVPGELRAATLAALRKGVTSGELYRSCGVSWGQLEAWKAGRKSSRTRARKGDAAPADVRVFSVVDAEPEPAERPALTNPLNEDLELRLGRWSVRVRLAEPGRGG
jgi:hypothetical protein